MESEIKKNEGGMTDPESERLREDAGPANPETPSKTEAMAEPSTSASGVGAETPPAREAKQPEASGKEPEASASVKPAGHGQDGAPTTDEDGDRRGGNDEGAVAHIAGPGGEEIQRVTFPSLQESVPEMPLGSLESLRDITLDAEVELGNATLQIEDILKLGVGSVVELNQRVDEPVRLLINNNLYALGEVVVVGDKFGLRIHKLSRA